MPLTSFVPTSVPVFMVRPATGVASDHVHWAFLSPNVCPALSGTSIVYPGSGLTQCALPDACICARAGTASASPASSNRTVLRIHPPLKLWGVSSHESPTRADVEAKVLQHKAPETD